MLSHLDRHDLAISSCGIPLIAELMHVCLNDPPHPRLEQALIWLALLHGLEELGPALATAPAPLALTPDQAVALYAAMHLGGNPAQAGQPLLLLVAGGVAEGAAAATETPWQAMNRVQERAESSPWAELIRQSSLLHLSDPAALFEEWLSQLDVFLYSRMPFAALLSLSILCRRHDKLPKDWQPRLANAISAVGDLADAIPLYRFWMVACQVAPDWDYASIRAADMALRFEDFEIAYHSLECMELTQIKNPWFYDVKARCRYAYGDMKAAVRLWSVALSKVDPSSPEHRVFHDRMLVALRGKFGLAEAARLARRGQNEAALQLLRILILNDPGFANHYKLLAAVQTGHKVGESCPIDPPREAPNVESVIERFRPLWLNQVGQTPASDAPELVQSIVQKAVTFLDSCEQSLSLTAK
jgi:tetratricopeptide (TPR) repeat protein